MSHYCDSKFQGAVPPTLGALDQMAAGLGFIHSQNMAHQSIKPSNILIFSPAEGQAQLKLSDFGISKSVTQRGTSIMTSSQFYLAPELQEPNGDKQKRKDFLACQLGDVFALGCVFVIFLTKGKHPFGNGINIPVNICNGKSTLTGLLSLL